MSTQGSRSPYNAIAYIISCVLNGIAPDKELIAHIPQNEIYSAANFSSLIAIVTEGLEQAGIFSQKAAEKKMLAARKAMLFDSERTAILSELERLGIKYMPLKGVILKELYPSVGQRQMADNDILFDSDYREQIKEIMLSRGYTVVSYNTSNHDVYEKEPVYNFEMHTALFSEANSTTLSEYYSPAFDMAIKDGGNAFGYHFSDEDFYIYIKAHEYKHFSNSGTGMRSLVDSYVYLMAKESELDFDKVESVCRRLGIAEYESRTRALAKKLFSPKVAEALMLFDKGVGENPLTEREDSLLCEFCFVGTYGTVENHISSAIAKGDKNSKVTLASKTKYLISQIFPPMSYYEHVRPDIRKKKHLIPLLWIKRTFRVLFKTPGRTFGRIFKIIKSKGRKKDV